MPIRSAVAAARRFTGRASEITSCGLRRSPAAFTEFVSMGTRAVTEQTAAMFPMVSIELPGHGMPVEGGRPSVTGIGRSSTRESMMGEETKITDLSIS
ncbi:hypothetical protein [Actinomadura sp. CNU-125]|uniref:hypothetical protein n=1 Tax=Actinomadura sp. CNU-125 TaxID=1904961 RepID=UPI00165273E3|nr:hypothetical protein [Actinomadura sp. CNU-125]